MKAHLLAAAFLLATPAAAADLMEASPEAPRLGDWHGFYAGAIAGLATSYGRADLGPNGGVLIPLDIRNGLFARSISDLKRGLTGGITAGFAVQSGRMVGGVEADAAFANFEIRHTMSRIDPNPFPPFTGLVTKSAYETTFGAYGTARLRGGIAVEKSLFYVTGGLAAGKVTNRFAIALPGLGYTSPDWSTSKVRFGYAIGAGVETKITEKVSVKLEGLYVNLADSKVKGVDPVAFPGERISYKFKNDMLIGRVGVNYRF